MKHGILINYVNESGCECESFLEKPLAIDHSYYKSKRNAFGIYEKVEFTNLSQYLKLIRKSCSRIRIKQI